LVRPVYGNSRLSPLQSATKRYYRGSKHYRLPRAFTKMKSEALREFTGKVPIASIQYHAIFALCLEIITEMAILKFEEDGRDITRAIIKAGLIFIKTLLVVIVEHQRDI